MATYKFHNVRKGKTYTMDIDDNGYLMSVTISCVGGEISTTNRVGRPVELDDLEVNIGASLRGKGSNNPEFQAILSSIQKGVSA